MACGRELYPRRPEMHYIISPGLSLDGTTKDYTATAFGFGVNFRL